MYAAMAGSVPIVELLISARADLNAKQAQGGTALMLAQKSGHPEVAAILKKAGAKEQTENAFIGFYGSLKETIEGM